MNFVIGEKWGLLVEIWFQKFNESVASQRTSAFSEQNLVIWRKETGVASDSLRRYCAAPDRRSAPVPTTQLKYKTPNSWRTATGKRL